MKQYITKQQRGKASKKGMKGKTKERDKNGRKNNKHREKLHQKQQ